MHSDQIARHLAPDKIANLKILLWKMHLLMMKLPQFLTAQLGAQTWVGPTWFAQTYRDPTAGLKSKLEQWKKVYFKLRQEAAHMKLKQLTLTHFKDNCKHCSSNALGRNNRPQPGKLLHLCHRQGQVQGHHLMFLKTLLRHTLHISHRLRMVQEMHGYFLQCLMCPWPLGLR